MLRSVDNQTTISCAKAGVFVKLRPEVVERGRRLRAGFESWRQQHPQSGREFPDLPYLLLHSLSHLLLTAVSLECGYPASSIRERVYALDAGYGILLYTGTPDAEGTLGGPVETGRQVDRHLRAALELGRLCGVPGAYRVQAAG
jgi:Domain of unknown function (DUF1998)